MGSFRRLFLIFLGLLWLAVVARNIIDPSSQLAFYVAWTGVAAVAVAVLGRIYHEVDLFLYAVAVALGVGLLLLVLAFQDGAIRRGRHALRSDEVAARGWLLPPGGAEDATRFASRTAGLAVGERSRSSRAALPPQPAPAQRIGVLPGLLPNQGWALSS